MTERHWSKVWQTWFGDSVLKYPDVWQDEMAAMFPNISNSEIITAIRLMYETKETTNRRWNPTLEDLISALKTSRLDLLTGNKTESAEAKRNRVNDDRKTRIRSASTHLEAWSVICEPSKEADCESLERYAERVRPGFSRAAAFQEWGTVPDVPKIVHAVSGELKYRK